MRPAPQQRMSASIHLGFQVRLDRTLLCFVCGCDHLHSFKQGAQPLPARIPLVDLHAWLSFEVQVDATMPLGAVHRDTHQTTRYISPTNIPVQTSLTGSLIQSSHTTTRPAALLRHPARLPQCTPPSSLSSSSPSLAPLSQPPLREARSSSPSPAAAVERAATPSAATPVPPTAALSIPRAAAGDGLRSSSALVSVSLDLHLTRSYSPSFSQGRQRWRLHHGFRDGW